MTAPGPFAGAVLCGGASSRMGRDKALLPVHGVPMARRVADALRAAGAVEVLAIGGDAAGLGRLGLDVRSDRWPGDGPLPTTLTALEEVGQEVVLVVSCDLVHPSPDAMRTVVTALEGDPQALVAVPLSGGHHQWAHAAWRAAALAPLRSAWEGGARSLRRAAADLARVELTDLPAATLADADTPGDLPDEG